MTVFKQRQNKMLRVEYLLQDVIQIVWLGRLTFALKPTLNNVKALIYLHCI